jgi:hypothetical protein
MELTKQQLAAAFNEWMRRYTENPEQFAREWQAILDFKLARIHDNEPIYGAQCAEYLLSIIEPEG